MTHATITAPVATTTTPTPHACLMDCGEDTTHPSGVCDTCHDHPDAEADMLEDMAEPNPYADAA
jgi:hypothetical protein